MIMAENFSTLNKVKKTAVFIGSGGNVGRVYSPEICEKLRESLDFPIDHVISKSELNDYRDVLAETAYLFSTWGMPSFTNEEIREFFPSLRAVFYAAGSVQQFARPFLEEGVAVFSAWAANGVPVAEYTFAEIILASKGFYQRLHRSSDGSTWKNRAVGVDFPGNYEIAVGVIGAGMIGKMVIERLKSLDKIETLVFDPFLSDEMAAKLGVRKVGLAQLFEESDVITNHLANNPATVGMINADCFNKMKAHAVFINTGRGAQVVESDMIEALREVPTRAAVLDVTYPEPPAADSPLYTMENVFLTPHIAGSIGNEVRRMGEYMYKEYAAFDAGLPVKYDVTLKMLETMA